MTKTPTISFRPRNGVCAEAYWTLRHWCQVKGFSFSDVLNAILPALTYYLHNHCVIDAERNKATVELNAGFIEILHVINGRCYPIISETNVVDKHSYSLEEIEGKIRYWHEQNRTQLSHTDLILLNPNSNHDKAGTSSNRKR